MSIFAPLLALALHTAPEVSLGVSAWEYRGFLSGSPLFFGAEVAYRHPVGALPLRLGAILRSPGPAPAITVPIELGVLAELSAPLGTWQPAVAIEVGWSGLAQVDLSWRGGLPPGAHDREEDRIGPWYAGITMAPLRFGWGRWSVSALELQLGATGFPLGAGARVQLSPLRLGVSL